MVGTGSAGVPLMDWGRCALALALGTLGEVLLADSPAQALDPQACTTVDVDYAIVSTLQLRNTRLGAADGVYPSGSGTLTLRIEGEPGAAGRPVRLLSFQTRGRFAVEARVLAWSTRVVTDALTTVQPNAARGTMKDGVLTWSTKVPGYRSDGTLSCEGSMCGSFGAPARGASPLHDGPREVTFSPFVFARDQRTFTMGYTPVSRTADQSSYLAVSGRELARRCAGRE